MSDLAIRARPLTESEVKQHLLNPKGESSPSPLKKMRHAHHNLARLIASGTSNEHAAQITGYDAAYICNIQKDPAFKNLVTYYGGQVDEIFATAHERMADISMVASEELLERLTEKPEEFDNAALLEVVKTTADRTGFGPSSRNLNVNVNVDLAQKLERARTRSGLTVEQSPVPVTGREGGVPLPTLPPQEIINVPLGKQTRLPHPPTESHPETPSKTGEDNGS